MAKTKAIVLPIWALQQRFELAIDTAIATRDLGRRAMRGGIIYDLLENCIAG